MIGSADEYNTKVMPRFYVLSANCQEAIVKRIESEASCETSVRSVVHASVGGFVSRSSDADAGRITHTEFEPEGRDAQRLIGNELQSRDRSMCPLD